MLENLLLGRTIKQYELTNHLGNVLVTLNDRKLGVDVDDATDANGNYHIEYYLPDVLSTTDYYAFGAEMPGRQGVPAMGRYRFGFNGMERDGETPVDGNSYTTDFRQYDPRLGRWLSVDPIVHEWESPYVGFSNNPIYFADPSGLSPNGGERATPEPTEREAAQRRAPKESPKVKKGSRMPPDGYEIDGYTPEGLAILKRKPGQAPPAEAAPTEIPTLTLDHIPQDIIDQWNLPTGPTPPESGGTISEEKPTFWDNVYSGVQRSNYWEARIAYHLIDGAYTGLNWIVNREMTNLRGYNVGVTEAQSQAFGLWTTVLSGPLGGLGAGGNAANSSEVALNSTKQLQAKFKHAVDFGIVGNYNKANMAKYSAVINQHLNNPGVRIIHGTYRGNPVIHYLNPNSGINVMLESNGTFLSGWKLNQGQLQNVLTRGSL